MIDHPCELYGKSLDCQTRHIANAFNRLGKIFRNQAQKMADVTTAWASAAKKMRGHTNETD